VKNRVQGVDRVLACERPSASQHLEDQRAPKANRLARPSTAVPRICSGDRYPAVPSTTPVSVE
jgi:hypothetical protein